MCFDKKKKSLGPKPTSFLFPSRLASPGRKILAEEEEEQHGSQTLTRRPQVKGKPDHSPSSFPRARERSVAIGGCRSTEGVRPIQERRGLLRGQIWNTVRDQRKCVEKCVNGTLTWLFVLNSPDR